MQLSLADQSLFSLDIPALSDMSYQLLDFTYLEHISQSESLTLHLKSSQIDSADPIIHQRFHLTWNWEGIEQHLHGLIKSVKIKADGLITLICDSPLLPLKQVKQSRHFTYLNLQSLVKTVLTEAKINLQSIDFDIQGEDPIRDFTAQHDESNLSFLERILHEVSWVFYLIHGQDGVSFHVTDHPGGYPTLSKSVSYHPIDQGTKTIESVFEIKHHRDPSDYYSAKSDCLGIRAGQIFSLIGHPDKPFNQSYLVTSVEHSMDEQGTSLRYQNSLKLLAADQSFAPVYSEPDRRINTLSVARIHSENEAPQLTDQGLYLLNSPHTETLTHPVRLATPYAGLDHGLHFPLHDKTQVLVAYLNGHPDQPVILGALFNDEQRNIVTSENSRQNLLITESGHTFLMDDTPGSEKIRLHTPEQENVLLLDGSENHPQIKLTSEQGEFHASISLGTAFNTQESAEFTAGQSIEIRAKQDCSFFSDEANFKSESAQDQQFIAGKDLNLHADNDFILRVDKDLQTTVKGNMRTDLESGDYQLKLSSGSLTHEAQRNLLFSTACGDLVLKTAGASVTFQSDGNIVFSAKKIVLNAGSIDIHNAGEGAGN